MITFPKIKKSININKDINYYFDNNDNNLGLYFLSIINKSKLYYFIELHFECINCECINFITII